MKGEYQTRQHILKIKTNENCLKIIWQRHNLGYIFVDIFSGKYTDREEENQGYFERNGSVINYNSKYIQKKLHINNLNELEFSITWY